jgi:hypothetical protein
MSFGRRIKRIRWVKDKIYGGITGSWESPAIPFDVPKLSIHWSGLRQDLGFVAPRPKKPPSGVANGVFISEQSERKN